MAKKKSSILMNTLVLFVVTFIAVLALAVVNQITKEPIAQAEINARAEVYKVVYPGAENFEEIENSKSLIEGSAEVLSGAGYDGCFVNDALAVTDASGNIQGYVIAATSPSGYGGDLQAAVGITKDGKITGYSIVSHSETAGLGSKCAEPDFTNQFADKAAATLEVTKSGATADNQIDAVSGATITSNAATEAANAAIVFFQDSFGGGIKKENANTASEYFQDIKETVDPYTIDSAEETADGYKIVVSTTKGFAGKIQIEIGIDKNATISSFKVLESNETQGYGAVCTEEAYAKQFIGLKADAITAVDSGANPANNEVDAIAGATFTTRAVDIAVNGAVMYYQENYGGGLSDSLKEKAANTDDTDIVAGASVQKGA